MTAHVLRGDRERCLAAGMDAYLPKPIRAGQLLELIEPLLTPTTSNGRAASPIDATLLQETTSEDPALLREMVEAFRQAAPGLIAELQRAIANHDAFEIRRCAHALRGMVANFGAGAASEIAQELEKGAESGSLESAPELSHRLARELALLETHLVELAAATPHA